MIDELKMIADARPEVAPYSTEAKMAARRRLSAAMHPQQSRRSRRPFGVAIAGAAMMAAASVTAVTVLTPTGDNGDDRHGGAVVTLPEVTKMSAAEILNRAAAVADLHPRDDQFIKVNWRATYTVTERRKPLVGWIDRNRGTSWISADGKKDSWSKVDSLRPLPHPGGGTIPKENNIPGYSGWYQNQGKCVRQPNLDYDTYTSLKELPDDAAGMRAFLERWHPADDPDSDAWSNLLHLLGSPGDRSLGPDYAPGPQRVALLRAAATLPDVIVTESVTDLAGRKGIGIGKVDDGVRRDIIFDPTTYELLGTQDIVVDANYDEPILSSYAELEVSVVDKAPEIPARKALSSTDCS